MKSIQVHIKESSETRVIDINEIISVAPYCDSGPEGVSWCCLYLTKGRRLSIKESYIELRELMGNPVTLH